MLAAQSEVLFTYPTRTGDYDKIGRPLLLDGVGRLIRFSPPGDKSSRHPACLRPPSAQNLIAEPLASPGWALTAPFCILMSPYSLFPVVVHTGKLQPVLLWGEKPVLLALPSNLGIPIPASYPVFRTKWREIS